MPRLDVTFKKGPVPQQRQPVSGIRLYWSRFVKHLQHSHISLGDNVRVVEVPLWQITENLVNDLSKKANRIYIPHKMKLNWELDSRILYYMQMVIPSIFSIDSTGWCASASYWPISEFAWQESEVTPDIYTNLRNRIATNTSKFAQPQSNNVTLPSKYILFPCQIPHDETIRYHSDINIFDCLKALILSISNNPGTSLVIKGHPANLRAMEQLRDIYTKSKTNTSSFEKDQLLWVDDISIHTLLSGCSAVFTVNSGVGLEALLHKKKVYTFGNADYFSASTKIMFGGSIGNASKAIDKVLRSELSTYEQSALEQKCRRFINSWYYTHFDCDNPQTFKKIKEIHYPCRLSKQHI